MKHPETHIVNENATRPAGRNDECFYCQRKLGEEHKEDCVIRKRTIVLKYSFEVVVEIPEDWDQHQIEFHRNESSWCANNAIQDLKKRKENVCYCNGFTCEYLREADENDEEKYDLNISDSITLKGLFDKE